MQERETMRIGLLYFSATGNTAKMAHIIAKRLTELGGLVDEIDITPYASRKTGIDLERYDAVMIGAPVYSWRAPRVLREWIPLLEGNGKKCSTFFTYGGFQIHPAHHSTRILLEEQGFTLVSSAEFLSAHTFNIGGWKAMEDRPDESDFAVAREYAEKTYARFTSRNPDLLGEFEKTSHTEELLDSIESFRFRILTRLPTRNGADCSMCRICEECCPTGAIHADTGEAEREKCIACLACVSRCPDGVLAINDMSESWAFKLKGEKITEEEMKEKKSRIYL